MQLVYVIVRSWDNVPQTVSVHTILEGAARSLYRQVRDHIDDSDDENEGIAFTEFLRSKQYPWPWEKARDFDDLIMRAQSASEYLQEGIYVAEADLDKYTSEILH
jgi:hypothetical protein